MSKPYSIKVFLPGGDADGVRVIEKSNWSGVGLVLPRALLVSEKQRPELARTGVYVLLGPPELSGLARAYVGEGDPVRPRLEQHAAKKDFWTHCIAFTSKDGNLNKAHVQHLEARLVALAAQAKRCVLENRNAPALPSMSEADAADAEGFLAEMLLCFPVLGVGLFSNAVAEQAPGRTLHLNSKGVEAQGQEAPGGFVVLEGSAAFGEEVASCPAHLRELRRVLLESGALKRSEDSLRFAQDYLFPSPSTAAGVVLGRSANGRVEWKTPDGKTLKESQELEATVRP